MSRSTCALPPEFSRWFATAFSTMLSLWPMPYREGLKGFVKSRVSKSIFKSRTMFLTGASSCLSHARRVVVCWSCYTSAEVNSVFGNGWKRCLTTFACFVFSSWSNSSYSFWCFVNLVHFQCLVVLRHVNCTNLGLRVSESSILAVRPAVTRSIPTSQILCHIRKPGSSELLEYWFNNVSCVSPVKSRQDSAIAFHYPWFRSTFHHAGYSRKVGVRNRPTD